VCLHLGKREKRLSATPSFSPPHRWDLKHSIIGARFPCRTLLAKSQSDVFVSTFFSDAYNETNMELRELYLDFVCSLNTIHLLVVFVLLLQESIQCPIEAF